MSVKERMLDFLSHLGLSQNKFENTVGLSTGFVNNIGDSIRKKSLDKITKVYPELNTAWLLTGVGSMLIVPGQSDHNKFSVNSTAEAEFRLLREKMILMEATAKVFGMTLAEIKSKTDKSSYSSVALELEKNIRAEADRLFSELKRKQK